MKMSYLENKQTLVEFSHLLIIHNLYMRLQAQCLDHVLTHFVAVPTL